MVVDCHIHARDFREKNKETIEHALEVACDSGIDGVFAMPNTNPPLLFKNNVLEYKKLYRNSGVKEVFFGV